jgi:hypothetical protein
VGLFRGLTPEPSAVPWLFLIKVELESALQRQIQPYGPGGMQTVLTSCTELIPKLSTEKVHKFALVRYANDPSTYDVLMTDPQGGKPDVAKFFAEDFLQTVPFRTADEQAELLFTRTMAWVAEHEETLSPQEQGEVMHTVRTLLTERVSSAAPVVPRELVAALPLTELRPEATLAQLRQSFEATLTAPDNGVDSIPVDRELIVQTVPRGVRTTRITYELDFGVQLSGEPDAIERLCMNPPHRVNGSIEFTIRSTTFRPLL